MTSSTSSSKLTIIISDCPYPPAPALSAPRIVVVFNEPVLAAALNNVTPLYQKGYGIFITNGTTSPNTLLALTAASIIGGQDDNTTAAAISTMTIRGGDHTFAAAKGVNLTIRPGRGDATTDDGILSLQDSRSNTIATFDYLGWSLSRMGRMTPTTTSANPYTVLDTDLVLIVKASGDIDLPASPTTNRVLYVVSGGAYTPRIDGNGKNINGSATKSLGNYEGVILMYDGAEWWCWQGI